MSDLCSSDSQEPSLKEVGDNRDPTKSKYDSSSNCRGSLHLPEAPISFGWGTPLQLGGRADDEGAVPLHAPPIVPSFTGCIASIRINGKVSN